MTTRQDDAAQPAGIDSAPAQALDALAPPAASLPSMGGLGFRPQSVRLKSLILDNFKSFAQRTKIDLLDGFTAVAGPNGSGKSNLIDAMLFVLGFASSKGLRADRLTDLINSDSGKPIARVSLELEIKTDKGELRAMDVSRVVRRRAGTSEAHYELDGAVIKLQDLHELLNDLGLPSSGLNVVVQNDVTKITALGEIARRQILDELAGAKEYDRRIRAANSELGEADIHEKEMRTVLAEIETQLVALEKQKEKAFAFQALTVEKDRLTTELFVLDVLEAQSLARKKTEELAARGEKLVELKGELALAEKESVAAKAALDAVEAEIEKKGEGERLHAVREIEALRANVANVHAKATEARKEAADVTSKDEEREAAHEAASAHERALAARVEALKAELDDKGQRHDALRREVDLASGEIQKRTKGIFDVLEAERTLRADVGAQRANEAKLVAVLSGCAERTAREGAQRGALFQTLEADRARHAEVERSAAEAASLRRIAAQDVAREEERLRKLLSRSQGLRSGLEKAEHDLAQGMAELGRIEGARRAALDHSGGRGLEALKREGLDGVHGPVHELFRFDVDHALAIEAAAGARLNHVVVEDEHVGKRAIEVLKRTGAGRMSFMPITKINPPKLDLRPVKGNGVIGWAFELVEFEAIYSPIMRLVLGETLIVDTMQAAIELGIGRYRMVTLDGDLMDRSGVMSGGSASKGGTVLAAAARMERELTQRQEALDEIRKRRDAARAELANVGQESVAAQSAHGACQGRLSEANARSSQLQEELLRLESKMAPAVAQLAQLDAALARAQAEAQAAETNVTRIRETLAAAETRLKDLPKSGTEAYEFLTEENRKKEEAAREIEAAMADVREAFSQVQVDHRGALDEVEATRHAIEDAKVRVVAAFARATEADTEAKRLEGELKVKERSIAALLEELRELTEKREDAKGLAQDMRDGAMDVARRLELEEKARGVCQQELVDLTARATALTAQAQEQNLALPPVIAADAEAVAGAIRSNEVGKLRDQARRELGRTEGKINALGAVNMLAIQQHADFSARKAELDERLATLDREVSAIRARIVELDGAKRTSFLQAFDAVAAAFKENFAELANGEGWLELTNPASPFEGGLTIVARPKGQKATRLEALSGGEKTLTALAFLFALQKVNPAPFFVFDEVDAALDGVNTGKLADAIRRRSSERQYFCISHKRALVEKAHQAIGVTKRKGIGTQVAGITLEEVSAVEAEVARQREAEKRAARAEKRPPVTESRN
jgi:chromosome segregation protein